MRIIARNKLVAFWSSHPAAEASLRHRHQVAAVAVWAMAVNGHTRAELAVLIGQSRATEVLGRQRVLMLPMIRKIATPGRCRSRCWCGNMRCGGDGAERR